MRLPSAAVGPLPQSARKETRYLSVLAASHSLLAAGAGKIPPSVVGGLDIGVQGYTFHAFDIGKMIDAMRSVGLSGLELWMGHLDPEKAKEADYRAARTELDGAGIHVSA